MIMNLMPNRFNLSLSFLSVSTIYFFFYYLTSGGVGEMPPFEKIWPYEFSFLILGYVGGSLIRNG